jgi:smad nuclear-interacting protein 1
LKRSVSDALCARLIFQVNMSGRERETGRASHNKRSGGDYEGPGDKRARNEGSPARSAGNKSIKEVWGKADEEEPEEPAEPIVKEKANFGLTGMLSKDANTGNAVNGVVIKFTEPLDSAKPDQQWRFYVFKDDKHIETLYLHRQSSYLVGRDNRVADVVVAHPSCSKQHAVIQYRKVKRRNSEGESIERILPYIMDLQSAQKTFVNGTALDDSRYFELREKDCIKFGASSRDYVLMSGTLQRGAADDSDPDN